MIVMSSESPVFYDCEASGLEGFVIEIGWAFTPPGGGKIVSAGYLVRPAPDWEIDASWDPNAEALHGVSLDHLLKHGRPAWEVARTMNRALAGRELFSDSPKDELWTRQIFDEAGVDPTFTLRRMDANVLLERAIADRGFDLARYRRVKEEAERHRRHRAKADALVWATLWRMVMTSA
jgi:hypothetical protein